MKKINESTYELEATNYYDANAIDRFEYAMNAVVHDGIFHADDVFFYVICREVFDIASVIRTSDQEFLKHLQKDIDYVVGDIGGGRYDHHSSEVSYVRPSGELYATFGLAWRDLGREVCRHYDTEASPDTVLEKAAKIIDSKYIASLDALDNQQKGFKSSDYYGLIKGM